jgi:hypothetical protein
MIGATPLGTINVPPLSLEYVSLGSHTKVPPPPSPTVLNPAVEAKVVVVGSSDEVL